MPLTGTRGCQEGVATKRRRYTRKAICLLAALALAAMIPMTTRADDRQGRDDEETFTVYNAARASWNSSRPRTKLAVVAVPLTTVAISVFAAALVFPSQILANNDDEISTFTVDVSLTPVYKQNNVDPSEGQDVFSPGDTFFQEGTIYPAGTLPRGKANNDPNAPGGIGKYLARGAFTADFANFEKAVNRSPGCETRCGFRDGDLFLS